MPLHPAGQPDRDLMFSIRQLFLFLSIIFIALLFAGLLLVRWLWFYPAELNTALETQKNEMFSLNSVLELKKETLATFVSDYANWDDTWHYVQEPYREYIATNFTDTTFESLKLSGALLLNNQREPVFNLEYNSESSLVTSNSTRLLDWLQQGGVEHLNDQPTTLFQSIDESPYLLAISPVMHSDNSGPRQGWLIFFQLLDDDILSVWKRITRIPLMRTDIPQNAVDLLTSPEDAQTFHDRCLMSPEQQPVYCFRINHQQELPQFLSSNVITAFLLIALIPGIIFILLVHLLITPIRKATDLLELNNKDGMLRPVLFTTPLRIRELRQLRDTYNQLVYTARQQQARLEQLSNTDRLTNIPNRRAFDDALESTWKRLKRHKQSAALILVDIDYFKRFNDHYGHQVGDDALHRVAQALKGCAKRTDEITSRFGGEEFALILYIDDANNLDAVRHRIHESIRELNIRHEHSSVSKKLTISFGIAWIRESGPWLENMSKEEWLRAADAALYEAKASGRNCNMLQIITPEMPFTESPVWQQSPD